MAGGVEVIGEGLLGLEVVFFEDGIFDFEFGREGVFVIEAFEFRHFANAVVGINAPLFDVGEEGLEFVKVAGFNGVEFVVVAFGAAEGAAKESGGNRADAFGSVFGEVFLGLSTAFAGHHVEAVVACGDELLGGGVGEEVAGELFAGELVEGFVLIEGFNHVIAVGEDALILVAMEADGVGEAGDVEPPDGHAFAEVGGGEEGVDGGLGILDGGLSWGEAGEVEGEAAEEGVIGGFGGGGEVFLFELGLDEGVDGVIGGVWGSGFGEGGVGPVGFVDSAFGDPASEELFLGGGEGFVGLFGRHGVFVVEDAGDDFAFVRVTGDDGEGAFFGLFDGFFADVEAEAGFAGFGVEAVAVEAGIRHEGADVAIERDRWRGGEESCGREDVKQGDEAHRKVSTGIRIERAKAYHENRPPWLNDGVWQRLREGVRRAGSRRASRLGAL